MAKLKQLEKLNLSSNKLDTLPVFVCKLHSLTHLNLKNNQIESLPVEIYLLKDNIRLYEPAFLTFFFFFSCCSTNPWFSLCVDSELTGNSQLQMPPRPKRHINKDAAWGDFSPK